MQVKLETGKL